MRGVYVVSFENIAIASVQDIISLTGATGKPFELHRARLTFNTTTAAIARLQIKRLLATVTAGSGGASVGAESLVAVDAAPTVTARRNDTTQATSATTDVLWPETIDVRAGLDFHPVPEDRPKFAGGDACVLELLAAITSTTAAGVLVFRELL